MPAHVAASRGAVQVLSCLVYDCKIHVVGDKAVSSKVGRRHRHIWGVTWLGGADVLVGHPLAVGQGLEPLDCVEGGDHYRCRALLKKLHARRALMYLQAGDFDARLLPTFSEEFEARYQSNARPFSRK